MRVVHLVAGNLFGGVESLLVTLARYRALAPSMEPHFALFFRGRLSDELERSGASVTLMGGVKLSRPWTMWRARRRLLDLVRTQGADLVISHGVWPLVVVGGAVRRAGLPQVLFQHTAARPSDWFERRASRLTPDALLANSAFTASTLAPLYPKATPVVFRCPVPVGERISEKERGEIRRELGIEPEHVAIIQTSRMEPGKGQRAHLIALGELKERRDWVSLQVGGPQRPEEERYYADLKALASELGIEDRVRFLGDRSDVRRLLSAADLHFQPSETPEGFGIAFIEAMLAGLPVVTTRLGAVVEYITAEVGFLASEPGELVSALERLLESPSLRREMGENARAKALGICAPERQVPELASLLAGLRGNFTSARQR